VEAKEIVTKSLIAVVYLVVVYVIWLVFPSEIPDLMYWGGAIFLLLFIVLASEKKQTKQGESEE